MVVYRLLNWEAGPSLQKINSCTFDVITDSTTVCRWDTDRFEWSRSSLTITRQFRASLDLENTDNEQRHLLLAPVGALDLILVRTCSIFTEVKVKQYAFWSCSLFVLTVHGLLISFQQMLQLELWQQSLECLTHFHYWHKRVVANNSLAREAFLPSLDCNSQIHILVNRALRNSLTIGTLVACVLQTIWLRHTSKYSMPNTKQMLRNYL